VVIVVLGGDEPPSFISLSKIYPASGKKEPVWTRNARHNCTPLMTAILKAASFVEAVCESGSGQIELISVRSNLYPFICNS